ncbi:hypothetical protein [Acinetobacter seifertii]|uniref:hypothetical protein n=1 Tax=Acinetobacter seifertii TaxID=1530123 RepID=UPI000C21FB33|nr:hypothetical protein [Acinetobacter seifertii]PJG65209.1 hypothetical protein CVD09_17540 [Acinetobacter seifertii]
MKTVEQEQEHDISINAAQLASFIVVLSGLAIVCISAYKTNAGLAIAIKNIFPSNTYSFVLLIVVGIIFCTFSLIKNRNVQSVTFKNEFLKHLGILGGVEIILFGLLSRVL